MKSRLSLGKGRVHVVVDDHTVEEDRSDCSLPARPHINAVDDHDTILMYVSRLGILLFCVDFVSIAIGMHHALIDFHLQDMRSHFIFFANR